MPRESIRTVSIALISAQLVVPPAKRRWAFRRPMRRARHTRLQCWRRWRKKYGYLHFTFPQLCAKGAKSDENFTTRELLLCHRINCEIGLIRPSACEKPRKMKRYDSRTARFFEPFALDCCGLVPDPDGLYEDYVPDPRIKESLLTPGSSPRT